MVVIGLTGGIGSGKTTVANLFAEKGISIIDTDQLARDVIQPGSPALKKVADYFGEDVLSLDGSLNRSALRHIVFEDHSKRLWLEQLLHPLIRSETARQIQQATSPYCIVVIPLLFETEPNPLIQRILVVDANNELQIERSVKRDNTTAEHIAAIMKTQVDREKRLAKADDIIHNHGSLEDLQQQVNNLHEIYLSYAKK